MVLYFKLKTIILTLLWCLSILGQESNITIDTGILGSFHNNGSLKLIKNNYYYLKYEYLQKTRTIFTLKTLSEEGDIDTIKSLIRISFTYLNDFSVSSDTLLILGEVKHNTTLVFLKILPGRLIFLKSLSLLHAYNKILSVEKDHIILGLNQLLNPSLEQWRMALGKVNVLTGKETSKRLDQSIRDINLLAIKNENLTSNAKHLFSSHLTRYKIDIFNREFHLTDSIVRTEKSFGSYFTDNMTYPLISKKELMDLILFELDYQNARMCGIQAIGDDTLMVVWKLPTTKIGEKKVSGNLMIDTWVNENDEWKLLKSDGRLCENWFYVFEQNLISSSSYYSITVRCNDEYTQNQPCFIYNRILKKPLPICYE